MPPALGARHVVDLGAFQQEVSLQGSGDLVLDAASLANELGARRSVFCFASEIKAILQVPFVARRGNLAVLFANVFERGNDRSEQTCFENIRQLRPSHLLRISRRDWSIRSKRYWSIVPAEPQPLQGNQGNWAGAEEEFRSLLRSAVRLRLRSDRPVGLLLSGGVDSSSIAATLKALGTPRGSESAAELPRPYTMALPGESMDESEAAAETCRQLKMPWRAIPVDRPDLERLVPITLWHNDEPLPLLNRCVHWQMMERIASEGIIVVLNGQGGDECTGGYFERLVGSTLAMALKKEGAMALRREWKLARANCGFSASWMLGQFVKTFLSHRWIRTYRALTHEMAPRLATLTFLEKGILRDHSPALVGTDYVNDQLMRWLMRDTVPDLCHYEDRNSAGHGLEERFPFLDYRLVEFMFRLPWLFKTYQGISKVLVRRAMRGDLPESVLGSHRKIGLGVPEDKWTRGPLAAMIQDIAGSRQFRERGLWRVPQVRSLIRRHMAGETNRGNLIWRVICTELWFRMFIDSSEAPQRGRTARAQPDPGARLAHYHVPV